MIVIIILLHIIILHNMLLCCCVLQGMWLYPCTCLSMSNNGDRLVVNIIMQAISHFLYVVIKKLYRNKHLTRVIIINSCI